MPRRTICLEGQRIRQCPHDRSGLGPLSDHHLSRLDCHHLAVYWAVGAATGANIDDRVGLAQCSLDLSYDGIATAVVRRRSRSLCGTPSAASSARWPLPAACRARNDWSASTRSHCRSPGRRDVMARWIPGSQRLSPQEQFPVHDPLRAFVCSWQYPNAMSQRLLFAPRNAPDDQLVRAVHQPCVVIEASFRLIPVAERSGLIPGEYAFPARSCRSQILCLVVSFQGGELVDRKAGFLLVVLVAGYLPGEAQDRAERPQRSEDDDLEAGPRLADDGRRRGPGGGWFLGVLVTRSGGWAGYISRP